MACEAEFRTFLRRTPEGAYRLEAEDGSIVVQSRHYRDLRRDLAVVLAASGMTPERVKILVGAPRRPVRHADSTNLSAAPGRMVGNRRAMAIAQIVPPPP